MLAPDAGAGAREDGFLQAWEILRHPLQARLVVLSACETARGRLVRGEGVQSFSRAFLAAGGDALAVNPPRRRAARKHEVLHVLRVSGDAARDAEKDAFVSEA